MGRLHGGLLWRNLKEVRNVRRGGGRVKARAWGEWLRVRKENDETTVLTLRRGPRSGATAAMDEYKELEDVTPKL